MKQALTIFVFLYTLSAFGQTSEEHLQNGISKHNQQDYDGAIKDYDKAIKADKSNKVAYFNRGLCEFALKDYKSAMTDFSTTIELDPNFIDAYLTRAIVFASQEKYAEALPDLDKTIELDPTKPNALTLRGQIRVQTGNKDGACEDFNNAKLLGDKQSDEYISEFCVKGQFASESLMIDWPDEEGWKVANLQDSDEKKMIELLRNKETFDNWTEIGTMYVYKNIGLEMNIPITKTMELMYVGAKRNCPSAILTIIEKDDKAKYPWIIYKIECSSSNGSESQVWYAIQGTNELFVSFRAVKQEAIPTDVQDKWVKFFKAPKIVIQ